MSDAIANEFAASVAKKPRLSLARVCTLPPLVETDGDGELVYSCLPGLDIGLDEEQSAKVLKLGVNSLNTTLEVKLFNPAELPKAKKWEKERSFFENIFHATHMNPLSWLAFRSDDALETEWKRQDQIGKYVIHPCSAFRLAWDVLVIFIITLTLTILPVFMTFLFDLPEYKGLGEFLIFCDVITIMDFIFNFRKGVIVTQTDEIILDPFRILKNYVTTGCLFTDLIGSFPIGILLVLPGSVDQNAVWILGLLQIFRMARLLRYLGELQQLLSWEVAVTRLLNIGALMLLLSHWNGCIQYLVIEIDGFPEDSWVIRNGLVNATVKEKYTVSLFKAMSHMLSIGYGLNPPKAILEIWITICSMLLGATFYALFIAHMSSLLLSIDTSGRLYNEKVSQVKQYLRFRHVPSTTHRRVMEYYDRRYRRKFFDEENILCAKSLSDPLRKAILLHNCRSLVEKVSFLGNGPPEFICDIIGHLHFEVFLPGDYIIEAGKRGNTMYFLEHGKVEVVLPQGEVVNRLGDGSHFGEIALLMNERRVASVIAVETCDVFELSREDFNSVLLDHPYMHRQLREVALERLKSIGKKMGTDVIEEADEESSDIDVNEKLNKNINEKEEVPTIPGTPE